MKGSLVNNTHPVYTLKSFSILRTHCEKLSILSLYNYAPSSQQLRSVVKSGLSEISLSGWPAPPLSGLAV